MDKINFQNLPNTTTPVNATNLNQMQTNIENAIENQVTYTLSDTVGWKRIAKLSDTSFANLTIECIPVNAVSLNLIVADSRGYSPLVVQNIYRTTNEALFTQARIVFKQGVLDSYLELYQNVATSKTITIKGANNSIGVSFFSQETAGEVPSGYSAYKINLLDNDKAPITQLLNATALTEKSEYTLSDNITNYKYIMIELSTASKHQNANRQYIPVSMLTGYSTDDRCAITIYQSASVYVFADFYFSASNKIYCYTYQKSSWTGYVKVYGIN